MVVNTQNIALLILAAGSSTRMGKPKQLLPWNGTTLLGNAINNALASRSKNVVVVLGSRAEVIRSEILVDGIETVENSNWRLGLGNSIATGIKFLLKKTEDFDGVLIMLADQPLIDTDYLNLMITLFYDVPQSIVATAYENRAGVPALFHRRYFNVLAGLEEDYGAKEIIEHNETEVYKIDPTEKSFDIDTQSQYQYLIKKLK